jgi:hypothetical protein
MDCDVSRLKILRKPLVLLLLMAVPVFARGQKPAPKQDAPARPAAPAAARPGPAAPRQATPPGQRPTLPSQGTRPGQQTGGGSKPGQVGQRPGATSQTRPGQDKSNQGKQVPQKQGGQQPGKGPEKQGSGKDGSKVAKNEPPKHPQAPGKTKTLKSGTVAHVRPDGKIRSLDTKNGLHIEHNLHGTRTIVSDRNGAHVVSMGRDRGYYQRRYAVRNGHAYYARTYYDHGVYRTAVYRGYYYGGVRYYGYAPAYYYSPAFYGWAYAGWATPVAYGWGWGGARWYGYYGFTPYTTYAAPAYWLTDYLIAANLQAAYAAANAPNTPAGDSGTGQGGGGGDSQPNDHQQSQDDASSAQPTGNDQVSMSPEVKEQVVQEVKSELKQDQDAAAQPKPNPNTGGGDPDKKEEAPPALDPQHMIFVVDTELAVVADDGKECSLTAADVLMRMSDTPNDNQEVTAKVTASKKADCGVGKTVTVAVDALQDMYNHFHEKLDEGTKELAAKQGKDNLPKSPDTTTVAGEMEAPPADKAVTAKALQQQQSDADQAELEAKKEIANPAGS